MFYSISVEMPRTSGSTPAMMSCPTMKFLPKLASAQCGLPSLSTMEHPTKQLKTTRFLRNAKKPAGMKLYDFKT
jgi:hypothetical protein